MPDVYRAESTFVPDGAAAEKEDYPRAMIARVLEKAGEKKGSWRLGAYKVCPRGRFINEQKDEEVVLLLRAHPITNLGWIALEIVLLLLPFGLAAAGVFAAVPAKMLFVGKLAWYLGVWGFAMEKFLGWYFSVVVVTNERVVDIDFINLLYRHVAHANLNHIEEPSMSQGGLIRSIFDFGDLRVATAADEQNIEGHAVPFPNRVVSVISELAEDLEKRRERGE